MASEPGYSLLDLDGVDGMPAVCVCGREVYTYASVRPAHMDPVTACLFFSGAGTGEVCCFTVNYEPMDPIDSDVCEYLNRLMVVYDTKAGEFKAAVANGVWRVSPRVSAAMDQIFKQSRSYRQCAAALLTLMDKIDAADIVYLDAGGVTIHGLEPAHVR